MILFLLPCFSGGGAERVVLNLLIGLHNHNHLVEIIVFNDDGPLLSMVPDGVLVHNLGTGSLRNSIIPLIKKLWKLRPGIIFSTLGYINLALLALRWFLPRKTNIWVREANLPSISLPNNHRPKLITTLYWLLYRRSNKLICSSIRMREEFISNFSVSKEIIEILPNPVDLELIRSSALYMKRFDNGGICYIASGRLTFQKGFDRLLKWFSTLDDKKSTLVILGDGDDKHALIQQSNELNLQNRVKFVGFCDNPWQWYAGADCFLLSSRWEGLPNVVLESLACGTRVISTIESGGVVEIAKQTAEGGLVVVSSDSSFIDEMLKVERNPVKKIKESLLPSMYHIESSVLIIERLIEY